MAPTVTVCITTYNHERYIAQALDSVLSQKTDFHYELLVGEDGSSDGTRRIVQDYAARYPDILRVILNDRKNVIYIDGRPTGRRNFTTLLKRATGTYIALLEGDDYWTSPYKLQMQVDFMKGHPECSVCFHNACVKWDVPDRDTACAPDGSYKVPPEYQRTLSQEDILAGFCLPTQTVLMRNHLISFFPRSFYRVLSADWFLSAILTARGHAGYIDKTMAVYRVHGNGVWSRGTEEFHRRHKLHANKALLGFTGRRDILLPRIVVLYTYLLRSYAEQGRWRRFFPLYISFFWLSLRYGDRGWLASTASLGEMIRRRITMLLRASRMTRLLHKLVKGRF